VDGKCNGSDIANLFADIKKCILVCLMRANFFSFLIVNMWNGLPDDVVLSPTLNSFKGRIDRHWRSLRFLIVSADDLT